MLDCFNDSVRFGQILNRIKEMFKIPQDEAKPVLIKLMEKDKREEWENFIEKNKLLCIEWMPKNRNVNQPKGT